MLTVKLDSPTPLVEQIEQGLRFAIATGELVPGDQLPPVRQLAADLGINLNTVARAYRALEACGLVTSIRGRGTQVTARSELQGPTETVKIDLLEQLRKLLADARLAGMDKLMAKELFVREMDVFWSKQ